MQTKRNQFLPDVWAEACEKGITMNDLISRKALLAEYDRVHIGEPGRARKLIEDAPAVQQWIPVTEKLPEAETEVLILATRKIYSLKSRSHTIQYIRTTGMYEDGTKHTEDSEWWWETDGFEYDEELDDYIIPEGWWEYKHYNGDESHNYAIDDVVTHWMPLPEPPQENSDHG
jgi:hypothetical protein